MFNEGGCKIDGLKDLNSSDDEDYYQDSANKVAQLDLTGKSNLSESINGFKFSGLTCSKKPAPRKSLLASR